VGKCRKNFQKFNWENAEYLIKICLENVVNIIKKLYGKNIEKFGKK
jgi:hypothetical protein